MYVCLCRGITDDTVRAVIASGATTLEDLVFKSGAGSRCRSCLSTLADLLGWTEADERPVPS